MRRTATATVFLLVTYVSVASAETWREFYERGEFARAAQLLHPLVFDALAKFPFADPEATEALARLYMNGTGVTQDSVVGCTFAMLANFATRAGHDASGTLVQRIQRLEAAACSGLSENERRDAGQMFGCPTFGVGRQVYDLDGGQTAVLSRTGIEIEHRGKKRVEGHPWSSCMSRLALARHTRVGAELSSANVRARDVLEMFVWNPDPESPRQQVLRWYVAAIAEPSAVWHGGIELTRRESEPWVDPTRAGDLVDVTFVMGATGEVAWHVSTADDAGVLPAPPDDVPEPLRLPAKGSARVDVTVFDRFGMPAQDAKVELTGVVTRQGKTSHAGVLTFDTLPAGRYDVVASAKGAAPSVPRVLDLGESTTLAVDLTLKRSGKDMTSIACWGFDPTSIITLGQTADLVVQVKIEGQESFRQMVSASDEQLTMTTNDARVLRSFRSTTRTMSAGSTLSIVQGGGRIDRGDEIDIHQANKLPPLNVGDEYVIFLTESEGKLYIVGAEEGVFRIRNGRVEPAGSGGAARSWKHRPADAFFESLRLKLTGLPPPERR